MDGMGETGEEEGGELELDLELELELGLQLRGLTIIRRPMISCTSVARLFCRNTLSVGVGT